MPRDLWEPVDKELAAFCGWRTSRIAVYGMSLVHLWRGDTVTLAEQHAREGDPGRSVINPVARLRYHERQDDWTLQWIDRNQRWHLVMDLHGVRSITSLLVFVDRDPTGVFWG